MNKKCNVVLLPQDDPNDFTDGIFKSSLGDLHYAATTVGYDHDWQPQHLYFTSNDKIKKGDWLYYHPAYINKEEQWAIQQALSDNEIGEKIVSSTDLSIGVPFIPQSFIQEYVKSNGSIKSVEIEQEHHSRYRAGKHDNPDVGDEIIDWNTLKLTKDGEVIVVPNKGFFEKVMTGNNKAAQQIYQQAISDQELEDAAKKSFDFTDSSSYGLYVFKEGYKAAEERYKNDAVKFAEYLLANNMSPNGFGGWTGKLNTNFYGSTTIKLFELWKSK